MKKPVFICVTSKTAICRDGQIAWLEPGTLGRLVRMDKGGKIVVVDIDGNRYFLPAHFVSPVSKQARAASAEACV